MGLGFTLLSAQNENSTDQSWGTYWYFSPVYCDGVLVDWVLGYVPSHDIDRSLDKNAKSIHQEKGIAYSTWDGEQYSFKGIATFFHDEEGLVESLVWHYHLEDESGSKYHGKLEVNFNPYLETISNAVCVIK
jgi:hypothetical protein